MPLSHALYLVRVEHLEHLELHEHIGFYGIHDRPIIAHRDAFPSLSWLKAIIGSDTFYNHMRGVWHNACVGIM
jgi:hypothetical protein